jgi:hypothetical protein
VNASGSAAYSSPCSLPVGDGLGCRHRCIRCRRRCRRCRHCWRPSSRHHHSGRNWGPHCERDRHRRRCLLPLLDQLQHRPQSFRQFFWQDKQRFISHLWAACHQVEGAPRVRTGIQNSGSDRNWCPRILCSAGARSDDGLLTDLPVSHCRYSVASSHANAAVISVENHGQRIAVQRSKRS